MYVLCWLTAHHCIPPFLQLHSDAHTQQVHSLLWTKIEQSACHDWSLVLNFIYWRKHIFFPLHEKSGTYRYRIRDRVSVSKNRRTWWNSENVTSRLSMMILHSFIITFLKSHNDRSWRARFCLIDDQVNQCHESKTCCYLCFFVSLPLHEGTRWQSECKKTKRQKW